MLDYTIHVTWLNEMGQTNEEAVLTWRHTPFTYILLLLLWQLTMEKEVYCSLHIHVWRHTVYKCTYITAYFVYLCNGILDTNDGTFHIYDHIYRGGERVPRNLGAGIAWGSSLVCVFWCVCVRERERRCSRLVVSVCEWLSPIRLQTITNAKISNKFSQESP